MTRTFRALLLPLALSLAGAVPAQDYPNRPVKIIVPYAAGGVPDVLSRTVGLRLTEALSQQFIVENRGGGGGISAMQTVAKSPPDGYTLVMADAAQTAINPHLFKDLPYDTLRDFIPITIAATSVIFLAANATAPITTFNEFVAHARANPGKLSYGSAGIGSAHHIAMEYVKAELKLDVVHVPYKGSGQSVPAFIAGDVQLVLSSLPALAAHVKSGKARMIGVNSGKRSAQAPDVPSIAEFIPGYDLVVETGLLAPAGTPAPVVAKLAAEVAKAMAHPETLARLVPLGFDAVGSTPEAFTQRIRSNLERFARIVKLSGAKAN